MQPQRNLFTVPLRLTEEFFRNDDMWPDPKLFVEKFRGIMRKVRRQQNIMEHRKFSSIRIYSRLYWCTTSLLQEMLNHEKNKTYAENILGSELPLQELVKHQRSEMNYSTTCTSKFPLQELTKHLNNIVYELQIFRQKYLLTVLDLLLTNSRL